MLGIVPKNRNVRIITPPTANIIDPVCFRTHFSPTPNAGDTSRK
jgi:hypothetical protein